MPLKTRGDILRAITTVVRYIEYLAEQETILKANKKELAIKLLNKFVDVPWLPEGLEEVLFGFAIDAVVEAFNQTLGNLWLKKLN